MRNCDPTINLIVAPTTCYTFGITEGILLATTLISTAVGVGSSMAQASAQGAAYEAQAQAAQVQAQNAQAIANYNAGIQRQNAEVAYQLAIYQNQSNAQLATFNQSAALLNQQKAILSQRTAEQNRMFSLQQAEGARKQYEQGLENAKTLEQYADTVRAQGEEDARRQREENERTLSTIRAKYGSSGVTFEGSPLVVLSDAASLAETTVQDIAYITDLERTKQLRAAELEEFNAKFFKLDELGYKVQARNYKTDIEGFGMEALNYSNQAKLYEYQSSLQEFDNAIAGAQLSIANNEAKLTELAGGAQAYGYEAEAAAAQAQGNASLIAGGWGAAGAIAGGLASGYSGYMNLNPVSKKSTPTPAPYTSSFAGAKSGYYR